MAVLFKNLGFRAGYILACAGAIVVALTLSGCDLTQNYLKHDRASNMEFQDFREVLEPRIEPEPELTPEMMAEGVPELQPYVVPPSDSLRPMPLVSISINQTVPLRDALFELAKQAGFDIELDPRITGSVIFTARERPFDLVIARIAEIAGLRYEIDNGVLRVQLDLPYHESYKIDYLNYVRTNSGSIRNDVSVVSGDGASTGSQFEITSTSESNFWQALNDNLTQILGVQVGALRTGADPRITATAPTAAPVEPVIVQGEDGEPQVQVTPPEAVLQVSSLPTDVSGSGGGEDEDGPVPGFSINRQAGIVSVYATERQHEKIEEYLRLLKRSVTAQVLIEAKVLEVSLSDEFAAGIDWTAFNPLGLDANFGFDSAGAPLFQPEAAAATTFFTYTGDGDLQAAVDAISRFGTVRALASPRLTVLNNQAAVLNVANNQVYFEIDIDVTTEEGVTSTEIDSEIRNVPEGVLINVQPSINLRNNTISMAVRPTITRIVDRVEDPAVAFVAEAAGLDITSEIPVLNVQELDSMIKVNSGQTIIMGGLMQDRSQAEQTGVPVLGELPLLGNLFKTRENTVTKSELVIFLKATIIDSGEDTIFDIDRDLYEDFSGDRRPLKM